jgi:hypothetical protein
MFSVPTLKFVMVAAIASFNDIVMYIVLNSLVSD